MVESATGGAFGREPGNDVVVRVSRRNRMDSAPSLMSWSGQFQGFGPNHL